jgi:6-pyruvoyltetrahydropterin/6-carboxytetrahydropterin synthase
VRIGKRFTFEAAHDLPNHDGKCRGLHGHSYVVEVVAEGEQVPSGEGRPDEGMVVDFGVVSAAFRERVHAKLDHRYLNDELGFTTTAENLAWHILGVMRGEVPQVVAVRVWETATSWAEAEVGR